MKSPTAPIRKAMAIKVYADTADGAPVIIDVPMGRITTPYVDQARALGTNVRIVALGRRGMFWILFG